MDSLPDQRIETLPGATRIEAYGIIGLICVGRNKGISEHEIAKRAGFAHEEAMYHQLKTWGLTSLLPPEKQEETPKPKAVDLTPKQRARSSGPPEVVPDASAAAELFNEALDELRETVKMLEHLSLVYQGAASLALTRLRAVGYQASITVMPPTLKLSPQLMGLARLPKQVLIRHASWWC